MKTYYLLIVIIAVYGGSLWAVDVFEPDQPNTISFPPVEARFVRLVIAASLHSQPCIDELEVYGLSDEKNLALVSNGAKAAASSCLAGYDIHQIAYLNDGLYGNHHSWIAAGTRDEWAQIELPKIVRVTKVVFSRDREGRYHDRMPVRVEIQVSLDGSNWKTVANRNAFPLLPGKPFGQEELLRYAFECEHLTWRKIDPSDSLSRILGQLEEMIVRFWTHALGDSARWYTPGITLWE